MYCGKWTPPLAKRTSTVVGVRGNDGNGQQHVDAISSVATHVGYIHN